MKLMAEDGCQRAGRAPRLLLADDHEIVREGLARLLEPSFEVVATVGDGTALLDAAHSGGIDVILSEFSLREVSGLATLKALRAEGSQVPFVFLTTYSEPTIVTAAIRAGANGYVLKCGPFDELERALEEVLGGKPYMTPSLSGRTIVHGARSIRLSDKQREVLLLVDKGITARQIGMHLGVSRRTVEAHKYAVMQMLGVQSAIELILRAKALGLLIE